MHLSYYYVVHHFAIYSMRPYVRINTCSIYLHSPPFLTTNLPRIFRVRENLKIRTYELESSIVNELWST